VAVVVNTAVIWPIPAIPGREYRSHFAIRVAPTSLEQEGDEMELILTDEEYYDLFKALRFAIEQMPDLLAARKDMLARMVTFYKMSPETCEFVITARETGENKQ
jgi:hypothetical protein